MPPKPTSRAQDITEIDTTVASEARVYDYLLGGTANFEVDREVAERQGEAAGGIENARTGVRMNRIYLGQAVRHLASDLGVRQFLDIGTGIPTMGNVHEVAQQVAPESRIVCSDYDPVVLAHARSLMKSTPEGKADFVQGDLREPEAIVEKARATLDFDEPIAVMLIAVLHFFRDQDDPYGLVARLMADMPSGSYLAMSHMTADLEPEVMGKLVDSPGEKAQYVFVVRTRDEVARFFEGYELTRGGVTPLLDWLEPDQMPPWPGVARMHWCAVGRKP